MPTQTAKFGEKKPDPGEKAAVQNETYLRGRGGLGAAAGRNESSSRAGAPYLKRYKHLRFTGEKTKAHCSFVELRKDRVGIPSPVV